MNRRRFSALAPLLVMFAAGCPADDDDPPQLAENIYARLGEPLPTATPEQLETFEAGREVAQRRFLPADGLGPTVNVSFCGSCHEKPVLGGGAPRYRDFYLVGQQLEGGFIAADKGGVLNSYGFHGADIRPRRSDTDNVVGHRNAIPFFGVGLIAEIDEEAILANEDPDDADGDGISGHANYDRGFVGRFGRKSQTVSIEGFIRGPLFNHLGITTDPLTDDQKARLPVPSVAAAGDGVMPRQAAAPEEPLTDDDGTPDPEMSSQELFDLVSFSMLLAAPEPAEPTPASERGKRVFDELDCSGCHVHALEGPRGLVPLYSDLLLHDMGPELADGIAMNLASGSEFRTQPLWGIAAVGPYLHDGRADTLDEAIRWHGGEAKGSRKAYEALDDADREDLMAFVMSLGGADQATDGLIPPDSPIPAPDEPGAPLSLAGSEQERLWLQGRALFDRNIPVSEGLGPLFNGDSCRACHFDPVIGGAGPIDVNVMRYGSMIEGDFQTPEGGTILHKLTTWDRPRPEHTSAHNVFEPRQTPTLLGLGLIDSIAEDDITAGEDPEDLDGDGIRGVAHILPDGRLGRLGWKAQVPNLREFTRDALGAEIGLTSPDEDGFTYGSFADDDPIPDPEVTTEQIDALTFFMAQLAPPLPKADVPQGRAVFEQIGCDACHTPELPGADGPVPLYSDLLLHDVAVAGSPGIDDFAATGTLMRTAPLWGLSDSAPYMHDGSAETVREAILAHAGEADAVRSAFEVLSQDEQAVLVEFLESL